MTGVNAEGMNCGCMGTFTKTFHSSEVSFPLSNFIVLILLKTKDICDPANHLASKEAW